jgi:hypothetical protein
LTNTKAEFVELIGEPETADIFSKALFYEKLPPMHPRQSLDSNPSQVTVTKGVLVILCPRTLH